MVLGQQPELCGGGRLPFPAAPYPMISRYSLSIVLLLAAFNASAQFSPVGGPVTNLQATDITATSATITFTGGSAGGPGFGCGTIPTRISYAYAGGAWVSVPYAMPLQLTGLQPNSAVTVQVIRFTSNRFSAGPLCGPAPAATITFTTLADPLAATPATGAGQFSLAPNPARDRATLMLAARPQPTPVQVLDALGRPVRQLLLPARATSAVLDVAGLPAGLYLVRCGAATRRLRVE
jgi:hypothetical protein